MILIKNITVTKQTISSLLPPELGSKNSSLKTQLFEHVKIQTNNICTRKCPYCYFGQIDKNKYQNSALTSEVVYRLLDELSALNFTGRVGLFEINEPLSDSRIYDFATYASKKIPLAWHMLITNGDLLTINNLKKLITAGLDQLCISVYDIKTLNRLTSFKETVPHLFNKVEIMDLINGNFPDNRGGNIKYRDCQKINAPLSISCERIEKMICIRPTGQVVSCPGDFFEQNSMGSVYQKSLCDIWYSDQFEVFRKEIRKGNRSISPLCSKCNYPGSGGFFKNKKK